MKYVVSWQPRSNATEEILTRALQVFRKWSPPEGTTFLQFLGRIDGPGGFAVVETDDPALLAGITAIFSAFFDMTIYPVLDIEEAARAGAEAIEFPQNRVISGSSFSARTTRTVLAHEGFVQVLVPT